MLSNEDPLPDWSTMYASAMRLASEVMEDDHLKIGENGLLYRVSEIVNVESPNEDGTEFVLLSLYHTGDETRRIVAVLCVPPHTSLKIYNQ